MTDYLSPLDSHRFGFNIARIDDVSLLLSTGFITSLRDQDIRLVITRTPIGNLGNINLLSGKGFQLMDVQSVWHSGPQSATTHYNPIDNPKNTPHLLIGPATAADVPAVREIAAKAFDGYGHYFADQRLDRSRCREIYPDWAARTLTNPDTADVVFVARLHGRIAGFLSLKIGEQNGSRYAAGVMGAIAEEFRGRHLFQALVRRSLVWQEENQLSWTQHNVLTPNIPVNRAFASCGFRPAGAYITLHGWIDR